MRSLNGNSQGISNGGTSGRTRPTKSLPRPYRLNKSIFFFFIEMCYYIEINLVIIYTGSFILDNDKLFVKVKPDNEIP